MEILSTPIRVLHVDDDSNFVDMAATFVEQEDSRFEVETATSVGEGLNHLADDDFDCVISDYDMPGQNGIEFLKAVREEYPDLPFLLYTGKGSEEIASEAISAGVTDYLQKETGTSQYTVLAHRTRNAVEQYRSRRKLEATESKLSQLAENGEDVLFMFTSDWSKLLFVSSAFEDIWGISPDRLEDDPEAFLDYIHPDDRDKTRHSMQRLSEGRSDEIEYRVIPPDGDQRRIRVQTKPIFDDDGIVTRIAGYARDITEQKTRERRLQELNDRFNHLAEAVSEGLFVVAADYSKVLYVNSAAKKLYGIESDDIYDDPTAWQRHIHPEDQERLQADIEAQLSGDIDGSHHQEFRIQHPERGTRWLNVDIHPIREDGEVNRLAGVATDVTERKERETELMRYERIVEDLDDVATIIAPDGTIKYVSASVRGVLGYDPEELIGENGFNYQPETTAETVANAIEYVVENSDDSRTIQTKLRRKDGSFCWIESTLRNRVENDVIGGVLVSSRDISDRKEREQTLAELHGATHQLMTAESPEAVAELITDAAGTILDHPFTVVRMPTDDGRLAPLTVTDELQTKLGGERPAYEIGEETAGLAFVRGETAVYDDVRDLDDEFDRGEVRATMYVPVGDHAIVTFASDRPAAFDESDIELAEILLAHAETALGRIEHDNELQEKNEQLSQFASVVSHDLRTPLSVSQGRLELVNEECDSDHLNQIETALDRIGHIIENVLWLTQEGRDIGSVEPIVVQDAIDSAWMLVADDADDARLEYTGDEFNSATIKADGDRLSQLLENLLRNAIKHGGEDVTVTVGAIDHGFYIEDDGPGILEDQRDDVFTAGHSTAEYGTGLGLSIVRRIVDAHGWNIQVAEDSDDSAQFEVTGLEFTE